MCIMCTLQRYYVYYVHTPEILYILCTLCKDINYTYKLHRYYVSCTHSIDIIIRIILIMYTLHRYQTCAHSLCLARTQLFLYPSVKAQSHVYIAFY